MDGGIFERSREGFTDWRLVSDTGRIRVFSRVFSCARARAHADRVALPPPLKFDFLLACGKIAALSLRRARGDIRRAPRGNVYIPLGVYTQARKLWRKLRCWGGIIVVEAGSCHGRVENYAPITIEIHFHNYLTTAPRAAETRTAPALGLHRDIPLRAK